MKQSFEKMPRNAIIENLSITNKNKEFTDKFLQYMKNQCVPDRFHKYKYSLYRFANLVEKDFNELTREDSREAGGIIGNSKTLSATTKVNIVGDVRRAMRYLFGQDEDLPDFIKPFKIPKNQKQKGRLRLPKHILDEKKTYSLVKACGNSRDKFFIALLGLDSGMRPCEAFRMKWKQIEKDEHSHYIVIDTAKKSGDKDTRVIRIIKSEPYFIQWMKDYPKTKTPEDFVFINVSNHKPLDIGTTHALFRRLRKKLKIDDKLTPYTLRHSLLTRMAKDSRIPMAVLKKFAGHTQRSNTIAEYTHIDDDDLKDMQLQINGKIKTKEEQKEEIKPVKCPKCNTMNEFDAEFCLNCNMALSQKRIVSIYDLLEQNNKKLYDKLKLDLEIFLKDKK